MEDLDLNLLTALDALLAEVSVTGAAQRLGLSTSAMSRTLTRLRAATGDPLLVRAGRGLVPTPRAAELQARVHELSRDVRAVLRPRPGHVDPASLEMTFTVRVNESFLEFLSVPVVAAVTQAAPRARLRFAAKPDKNAQPLREGPIDLEIGVLGTSAPEMRTQFLFRDKLVGVVRAGHPLLAGAGVTPERYAACEHVAASRTGDVFEPVDEALEALGLERTIRVIAPGYPDAMRIARHSDFVGLAPRSCFSDGLARDSAATSGLVSFALPVSTPEFMISAIWHPRLDADPAHRWFRDTLMSVCRAAHRAAGAISDNLP